MRRRAAILTLTGHSFACGACQRGGLRETGAVRFTAAVIREDGWFVARCLEVEVASQGRTFEDSLASLREALELFFEGEELPIAVEPPIIATVELPA